ncbi:hypothetical protein A3C09_00390 [Candidatus Uhrbacteria bacterium RIFCSPHIGHO2_02_FULL_47_44]|uniref:Uncharacterized protein n=1 Tax=Candidatus Uhrbacteria bacterium RIFCSPLOWO2_02_FULL_48_18 TaxID=1802408 RepID=A0A1F7V9A3_9BACT|nr:MAG: hypothetical protein A2839_00355 [Candidatus Uhrbacteria bacterium RIFCSPHIGHO2_01_FULL_47_10]OGL69904.1 MAG: hypothetical protein A3C09_00390 [Candidatus Uhrbacteria bacterium RIFCSPHIGHO2_02_FULL_47_44]OGL76180.1 MAG: hypothetical protein A3E97_03035 [Candidatus Uhrbacteria bacterium RIFCSPHIGHO2_12_FULL_47_12]OGL81900.1 MAG: hypothetical protein A3B20_02320 [Candidatus Uhrbacteria bacterium RIFCSPLOWO2_01_FULL_47_17]OGL87063.1 MAG: hypothetical protein A3I41_03910 [Candidatus Uhrbact
MTEPFTGSPIAHPKRKLVTTFTGHVNKQADDLVQMITMLQTGWNSQRAPKPVGEITIILDDDKSISGILLIESMSHTQGGVVQFFLTEWDETIFRCYIVIAHRDNTLRVEVWENPPDPYHISSPRVFA